MNLLKLTQDGSLLLAPSDHMRPDKVIKRMLPGLLIFIAAVTIALLMMQGGVGWWSFCIILVAFLVGALSLIIAVTMVFSQGTEQVPQVMKSEVLLVALHGGKQKGRRSTSIRINDEQYDLIRRLIVAQDRVRQAQVVHNHALVGRVSPAPGLPEAYRQRVRSREDAAVQKAEDALAGAESLLRQTRAEVSIYLDQHDLDEDTCEFWQGLWLSGRLDPNAWGKTP